MMRSLARRACRRGDRRRGGLLNELAPQRFVLPLFERSSARAVFRIARNERVASDLERAEREAKLFAERYRGKL